jgi:ABC-type transport system substrate-binding protein
LAHAWNQDALVAVSWQNTKPAVFHPYGASAACGEAKYRHYDPKKAQVLLKEYGKPVKITMTHTTTARGRELGELLQQMYKAVGVELDLLPVDTNTLIKRVFTKEYDVTGWRITDGVDQGPQIYALLHSKSSYNITGFHSPETDKIADEMRTATDPQVRRQLQCKIAEILNDQAVIGYRGGGQYYAFSRGHVRNVPPNWRGLIDVTSVWLND